MNTELIFHWESRPIDVDQKGQTTQLFKIPLGVIIQDASTSAPVKSVNAKIGDVVLDHNDVGADVQGAAALVQEALDSLSVNIDNALYDLNEIVQIKADKDYVDSADSYLNIAIETKADKDYVDQINDNTLLLLDQKVDAIALTQMLGLKADLVNGKIPESQLPSVVDDVLNGYYVDSTTFNNESNVAYVPESGKIYVDVVTNKTYRWTGSIYTQIGSDLALGETSATAYRGDRGKVAYDHSLSSGNPHGTTTSLIPEGTNRYFNENRVLSTTVTGITFTDQNPITSTDTILQALGKAQSQISTKTSLTIGTTSTTAMAGNSTTTDIAEGSNLYYTDVRAKAAALAANLTGLSTATSGTITSSDTVLTALGKLQNSITNSSGSPTSWVDVSSTLGASVGSSVDLPNSKFQIARVDGSIWVRGRIRFKSNAVAGDTIFSVAQSSYMPDISWIPFGWTLQRATLFGDSGTTISMDFAASGLTAVLYMNLSSTSSATGINKTFHLPPTPISKTAI